MGLAALALGGMGSPVAREAGPPLRKLTEDPVLDVRETALLACTQIFPKEAEDFRKALVVLRTQRKAILDAQMAANVASVTLAQARFDARLERSFNPVKEAFYDRVVDLFILAEGQDMSSGLARLRQLALYNLPPDSIFAVIRGVRRAVIAQGNRVFNDPG